MTPPAPPPEPAPELQGLTPAQLLEYEARLGALTLAALRRVMRQITNGLGEVTTAGAQPQVLVAHMPGKHNQKTHGHGGTAGPGGGVDIVGGSSDQGAGFADEVFAARGQYVGMSGDPALSAIANRQGFDGPPEVVSAREMDGMIRGGRPEMLRGMSAQSGKTAAQIHEEMRSGPLYHGSGVYGNGVYFAPRAKGIGQGGASDPHAFSDGSPGSVMRATLHPRARVVDGAKIEAEHAAYFRSLGFERAVGPFQTPRNNQDVVFGDVGRFAASRGYDAIHYSDSKKGGYVPEQWVVLNRSALIIEAGP